MIPSAWQLALLALGTYRAWRLVGLDDAPWLERFRLWFIGFGSEAGRGVRRSTLWKWLTCSWCAGTWLSGLIALVWFVDARVALLVSVPFAVATAVGALGHLLNE